MKKLLTLTVLAFLISFATAPVKAEDVKGSSGGKFLKVGAAGSQFLKIGVGARAIGMAGSYTAVANDLTSLYWNPAGLADIKSMKGEFHYTQWFAGFNHSFAALSMPVGENFTAGAHLISFDSDEIQETTMNQPEGTGSHYSVNDIALGMSFSGYLTDQFSFGVTGKYLHNGFHSVSSNGFAFDIGTIYETGIKGITLGFSIFNLGPEMEYQGQGLKTTKKNIEELKAAPWDVSYLANAYSVPLIFRAGVSSNIIDLEEHKLIAASDFVTHSDIPEQFSVGAEYTWNNLISFRGGYRFGHDQMGISGGVGFNYLTGNFLGQLDYSITPTRDIGLINRLSVSIGFK